LTSLDLHGLVSITTLNVKLNNLESLNLSGLNKLKRLIASDNPALTSLEASTLTSLSSVRAENCALEQVSLPASITEFYAKGNKLTKLGEGTVSFPKLQRLRLPNNQITEFTVGECPLLNDLELDGNKLTSLTLGSLPALKTLYLQKNLLSADALNKVYNALPSVSGTIKVAENPGAEKAYGYIATDKGWKIDVPGQKNQDPEPFITIKTKPDKEINLGLSGFAAESKVQIETDEGVVVEETITSGTPPIKKYKSTRGLIRIIGLVHTIDCSENGSIAYDIDASQSPKLVKFYALHNTMTSVNVKGCADLTFINCAGSELPEIDLSDCKQLETVWLPGNKMISIELTGLTNLQELSLERNLLTEIHGLSDCTKLTELNVAENELTTLVLTGLSSLNKLDCRENKLTALDLSSCTALTEAFCYKNAIKEPAMKQLFESLPTRSASERGELYAIDSSEQSEENEVNDADVKIATDKSWLVYDYKNYDNSGKNPLANAPVVSADHYRLMITGDYIEIAQATPHAVVELYALDGTLLQSARADQNGELRLSIAELPTGSYLLSVDGEANKVML
jgi:Leucine-rich repeat (LRR) protein